jgi:hypothetical protein
VCVIITVFGAKKEIPMGWRQLFGSRSQSQSSTTEKPAQPATPSRRLSEKDNVGTRYETYQHFLAFWTTYCRGSAKFPVIVYDMRKKKDTMDAMLSLPPVKTASDSGNLISTEILHFGVFPYVVDAYAPVKETVWRFFLAGEPITLALYDAAIASCQKYNGKPYDGHYDINARHRVSDPPKETLTVASTSEMPNPSAVSFDREEKVDMLEQARGRGVLVPGVDAERPMIAIKRHYKAPAKDDALAFLKANPVDKPLYSLIVHTPEGDFGRDKDGIFQPTD